MENVRLSSHKYTPPFYLFPSFLPHFLPFPRVLFFMTVPDLGGEINLWERERQKRQGAGRESRN